jgi:hypothetical protein
MSVQLIKNERNFIKNKNDIHLREIIKNERNFCVLNLCIINFSKLIKRINGNNLKIDPSPKGSDSMPSAKEI